jgi:hypothetical protein
LAVQTALEEVLSVPPEGYFRVTYVLPKGRFVHTPAFVGCTYSERLIELTFISGRPKEKRLALLVTGANRDIGAATVRELLRRDSLFVRKADAVSEAMRPTSNRQGATQ